MESVCVILEDDLMNRVLLSLLAVAAIAMMVNQAVAENSNAGNVANAAMSNAANNNNGGAVVFEGFSATSVTVPATENAPVTDGDMQPLPGDPGVEVAPIDSSVASQPVVVEEDMLIEQTEDGE